MKITICLSLLLATLSTALPAFPKKYDPKLHGDKRSSYGAYRKKFEYPLKAPEGGNSYGSFAGSPEEAILPPAVPAYITADGVGHEDLVPPPQGQVESESSSSYMNFESEPQFFMEPPSQSSYTIVSPNSDSSDAMAALSFMASALPRVSSYSRYSDDPQAKTMLPPAESTYLKYPAEAKSDTLTVPGVEPHTEKTVSSYSSYGAQE